MKFLIELIWNYTRNTSYFWLDFSGRKFIASAILDRQLLIYIGRWIYVVFRVALKISGYNLHMIFVILKKCTWISRTFEMGLVCWWTLIDWQSGKRMMCTDSTKVEIKIGLPLFQHSLRFFHFGRPMPQILYLILHIELWFLELRFI